MTHNDTSPEDDDWYSPDNAGLRFAHGCMVAFLGLFAIFCVLIRLF